jgi:hypothetical protein
MPAATKSARRSPPEPVAVQLATARELVKAGSVRTVELIGQPGGYAILLHVGMQRLPLGATTFRGPRIFPRLEAAASTLRDLGVAQFVVDASNYDPSLLQRKVKRPDARALLSEAHRARAHDKWFRNQVEASLANPNRQTVDAEAARTELRTHAETLRDQSGVPA